MCWWTEYFLQFDFLDAVIFQIIQDVAAAPGAVHTERALRTLSEERETKAFILKISSGRDDLGGWPK